MKNFSWRAPEYPYRQKSNDWFWTVGIITAALVVTCVIFGNFLFAIVLAIGAFSLTVFAVRKPATITVEIDEKGVKIDKTFYPYPALDSFGIDELRPGDTRLILKSKKVIMPLVSAPLAYGDVGELRAFLKESLREEAFEPSLMQTVFERLGF